MEMSVGSPEPIFFFYLFYLIKQLAIRRSAAQASKKERIDRLSATSNELHSQTCRIAR